MIPKSWYMVLPSSALPPGQTQKERVLGTELTLSRSSSGVLQVRDVDGSSRAAHEVNDMILVWEGGGQPDFAIEPCPELGMRQWTSLRWGRSPVYKTSVINVQRDVVDNDHFGPVHHLAQAETRAEPAGPYLDTVSQGIMNLKRLGGPPLLCHIRLDGRLHGVGLLTYRSTITLGGQLRTLVLSAPTPIDADTVRFHVGVSVWRIFPGASELMRVAVLSSVLADIRRDAEIWESPKQRLGNDAPRGIEQTRMFSLFDAWLAQHLPGTTPRLSPVGAL